VFSRPLSSVIRKPAYGELSWLEGFCSEMAGATNGARAKLRSTFSRVFSCKLGQNRAGGRCESETR
jgi:hypothetical protein